jgi:hypothetical protein
MSHKGYGLEHELEGFFLRMTGQTITDPIMDGNGHIKRTFRVPSSGAMASFKGDVRTSVPWLSKQFLIEAKHRREKSKNGSKKTPIYHLSMELVQKNINEAEQVNLVPIFAFSFKGSPKNRIHVVFREPEYMLLISNLNLLDFSLPEIVSTLEMRSNKKTYTIAKKNLDVLNGHPASFSHDGVKYVLVPLNLVGLIIESLKGKPNAI